MGRAQVAVEFMLAITFLLGIFFLVALLILDMQRIGAERYVDNQFEDTVQGVQQQLFLIQNQPPGFCTRVDVPRTIAGKNYDFEQKNSTVNDEPFLNFKFSERHEAIIKLYSAQGEEFQKGENYVRYIDGTYDVNYEGCAS